MSRHISTLVVKALLTLSLAVLSLCYNAQAQTFSTFGPPPTIYDPSDGYLVSGSASPYGSYTEAMSFVLGTTRKIDYASVAVGLYSGSKNFLVEMRKDCAGAPCPTPMYAWPTMLANYSYGSCCFIETTPTDGDQAALAGHTYWIVVKAKPGSNSVFVWNLNNIGYVGNVATSLDGGTTWPDVSHTSESGYSLAGH